MSTLDPAEKDFRALLSDSGTVAALGDIYERAARRIVAELAAGVSRPGAARARELLARIDEILGDLDPRKQSSVRKWIVENARKAYVLGDQAATKQIRDVLARLPDKGRAEFGEVDTSWTVINNNAMRGIAAAMSATLGQAKAQMSSFLTTTIRQTQVAGNLSEAILQTTTGGLLRGVAGQSIKDDIASILLEGKVDPAVRQRLSEVGYRGDMFDKFERIARGELITVGGKTFNVRTYADLVARTQMKELHKTATLVRGQRNGFNHVRMSWHPMEEPDECTPFAGKIFYFGPLPQDPLGFPRFNMLPSNGDFHPNCAPAGTMITTSRGRVPIEQIAEGMKVLTHEGRFRRVTGTMRRLFAGMLYGVNGVRLSGGHPVLTNRGWISARQIGVGEKSSPELPEALRVGMARERNAEYPPALQRKSRVALGVAGSLRGFGVERGINLDADLRGWEGKISDVPPDGAHELEMETGLGEYGNGDLLGAARLLPERERVAGAHLLSDGWIEGRVILDHAPSIACEGPGSLICNASGRASATGTCLDSEPLEMIQHRMAGAGLVANFYGQLRERAAGLVTSAQEVAKGLADSIRDFRDDLAAPRFLSALPGADLDVNGADVADGAHCFHNVMVAVADGYVKPRISRRWFAGWLYNFSVAEDESYIANGVVVHNCVHRFSLWSTAGVGGAQIARELAWVQRIPASFFGKTGAEVRKLMKAMGPAAVAEISKPSMEAAA